MTDLSPAAQGVMAAMSRSYDHEPTRRAIAAAILRSLADHKSVARFDIGVLDHWSPDARTRRELRNIAAELEAQR